VRFLKQDDNGNFVFTDMLHDPPPYAILSHTWSTIADAEVSHQDILDGSAKKKGSFAKILFMAERAVANEIEHFWIDTCCMDKHNEAEVSTSIRPMYRWYRNSTVQRTWEGNFRNCRWFPRGWTLQELIAPIRVEFYARYQYLESRASLREQIHEITGIHIDALQGHPHEVFPISARLRWATGRQTTVAEDYFYALMGLCDVVMSPKYGEGKDKAEDRLKKKIERYHGEVALDVPSHLGSRRPLEAYGGQAQQHERNLDLLRFETIYSRRMDIKKALRETYSRILEHPA
jgi:hypothetical protein